MKLRFFIPLAALGFAAPVLAPTDALACGGCYHVASETETTVVTGHRMVLAVSKVQTVLWDQIVYQGNPTEFAWVLPIKPGARLELSTDAWFETLDATTSTSVVSPELHCPPPPGARGGCSSQEASDLAGAQGPRSDVTVVHEGTVGPYETVTLSTDTPGALNTWLAEHDYAVDETVQPIIDAYVAEGFDFIALRLQPGQGVRAMKPVRVVSPGASPTLPLRMVAAGTGATVGITLFVIGEGRWATKNFPNGTVAVERLSWDFLTSESNYGLLREEALAAGDSRTWLTTYAKLGPLLNGVKDPTAQDEYYYGDTGNVSYGTDDGYERVETIGEAYFIQAERNSEATDCTDDFLTHALSGDVVVDPCPPGEPDPEACAPIDAGQIDARTFACGDADDLAVALTGMHPRDVWLTRLESSLPRAALASDLDIEASSSQTAVENWLSPVEILNEQEVCRASADEEAALGIPRRGGGRRPPRDVPAALVLAGLAIAAITARRTRRALGLAMRYGRTA
jgi:Uncharacterized protein conserved in bacteria (DUF2330)